MIYDHQCTVPKHKNQFSSAAAKSKKLFTSTRSRLASLAWWINDLNLSCALSDKNKTEKPFHLKGCAMNDTKLKDMTVQLMIQWFLRIRLFVVKAISLGPCRRPIEYLTSSHHCGRLSKIPNSQNKKKKKWKILTGHPGARNLWPHYVKWKF